MTTAARTSAVEQGLNGIARKVLNCVPMAEAWTPSQINAELFRNGTRADMRVVSGCLTRMRDDGLIREPYSGRFVRVAVTPKPTIKATPMPTAKPHVSLAEAPITPKPTQPPIERLAALASRARTLAVDMKALASELDEIAIEVDDQIKQAAEGGAELAQLKGLLRKIL